MKEKQENKDRSDLLQKKEKKIIEEEGITKMTEVKED